MIEDTETKQEGREPVVEGGPLEKDLCMVPVPGCRAVLGSSVGPRFPIMFSPCKWA